MGANAVPADAAQLHPALSSGTTQWGGLKKAHRAHAAAHRRALAEQLADLSSLVGGEFTTLGINHQAPSAKSSSSSRPLNGGEFTTLRTDQPAPSAKSSPSHSKADRTGPTSSRASGKSDSKSNVVGANSARDSTTSSLAPSEKSSLSSEDSAYHASKMRSQSSAAAAKSQSRASSSSKASSSASSSASSKASSSASSRTSSRDSSSSNTERSSQRGAGGGSSSSAPTSQTTVSHTNDTPVTKTVSSSVTGEPTPDPHENLSQGKAHDHSDHTGVIAGVSTAGGVVLLALAGFLIYKFFGHNISKKLRGDEIRWPEVSHDTGAGASAPLPARSTGGAGFEMGRESEEEPELSVVSEAPPAPDAHENPFEGAAPVSYGATYPDVPPVPSYAEAVPGYPEGAPLQPEPAVGSQGAAPERHMLPAALVPSHPSQSPAAGAGNIKAVSQPYTGAAGDESFASAHADPFAGGQPVPYDMYDAPASRELYANASPYEHGAYTVGQ